jgi:hypothetical protein
MIEFGGVSFGSEADIDPVAMNVRFGPSVQLRRGAPRNTDHGWLWGQHAKDKGEHRTQG